MPQKQTLKNYRHLQNTSLLNTAFESINSPLNRASYLLKLDGIDPFDENDTSMAHDFLISQIELREELEVIESKTDSDKLEDFILSVWTLTFNPR